MSTSQPHHLTDSQPHGMTLWQFFKRRLTRLHPIIIFATLFCMVFFYYGMGALFPLVQDATPWAVLGMMVCSMLMIPVTPSMDIRGWSEINPINGNAWTLYFEYLANILYALVIRHFPKWLLAIFVAGTAGLTLDLTLNIDMFGLLADRQHEACTVIGGWTVNSEQGYIGFVRLLYPFFAGLLLSRLMRENNFQFSIANSKYSSAFWMTAALLTIILIVPRLDGGYFPIVNGIYEAVAILLLFPTIVWMGAKGHVNGTSQKICKWLGEISYPLYVTHYCLVFGLLDPWHIAHPEATTSQLLFMCIGDVLLSIFIAWAAFKLYDEPVRKWLKKYQ